MVAYKEFLKKEREFVDYLASDSWKALKQKRLEKDQFQCVMCKSKEKLFCHHLTYERLYHENIDDLITLCNRCHDRIHNISPPIKQPEFTNRNALSNFFEPTMEDLKKEIDKIDF